MKPIRDPFGNTFATLQEFEQHYAVGRHEYRINRKTSWVYDYIAFRKNVIFDHKGQRYSSEEELINTYAIGQRQYEEAKRKRYSMRETLEQDVVSLSELIERTSSKEEIDYSLGYRDLEEMCQSHNVSRRAVYDRLRKGMCLTDALFNESEKLELSKQNTLALLNAQEIESAPSAKLNATKDKHIGFKEKKAEVILPKVQTKTRKQRLDENQIETNDERRLCAKKVTDEFGNVFASCAAFEAYYNVRPSDYKLISKNYYIVDYTKFNKGVVFDHLGQRFDNEEDMCAHWQVPYSQWYRYRKARNKMHYSIREVLQQKIDTGSELLSRITDESVTISQLEEWYDVTRKRIMEKLRQGMNYHDIVAKQGDIVTLDDIKSVQTTIRVDMVVKNAISDVIKDTFVQSEESETNESIGMLSCATYEAIDDILSVDVKNVMIDSHVKIKESAHIPNRPETYGKAWVVFEDGEEKIWTKQMFRKYCEETQNTIF